MGSFFGGLLAEKGLDVVLVDVWAEHVETINTRGLRIVGVGGDRHVKVNIFLFLKHLTFERHYLFRCEPPLTPSRSLLWTSCLCSARRPTPGRPSLAPGTCSHRWRRSWVNTSK